MTVSSVGAVTQAQGAAAQNGITKGGAPEMDYDAFLQLLVAQMKNQDPLNPAESTEYIAQFATFANVEQSIQTNTRLESMMTVSALTQADALIGRTLTSLDGATRGTVTSIRAVDGGIQATIEGGETIMLGDGVSVA
ncbi:flagellar basal-body rod modification protein D [Fulvimarina pelagi HTCC2506]|uniref:Basal-body rod modification protein FlgD n=2 Tax=Fulvimarina pelagi TaxID=217511 RepID=Q0G1E3_9HYPH|nr:flagellar hook assembly protein FlgD [Fulvimarina pelagi]EAU41138.1 flagellar basal-body rod modification protein D [Fulvimarina pelagi HTCC2506]BAT30847.1 flagellar basal-body rod modification protein D [Fulvimarina pelagi]